MNKNKLTWLMVVVFLIVGVTAVLADHNQPDYTFEQSALPAGNAASECNALGQLLDKEFIYSYKIDDWEDFLDPNGDYVANFDDGHSNTITISNGDDKTFDWSATNSIGAVLIKAGTGFNVWVYEPQAYEDTHLFAYEGRDISHVTFCWNPDDNGEGQWCSPGYWRQEHHLDSWDATDISPSEKYSDYFGYPSLSKQGERQGAPTDPTLWEVLQYPQWYGGDAFNNVGDLLSDAHPDVNYRGDRVEDSCPLN